MVTHSLAAGCRSSPWAGVSFCSPDNLQPGFASERVFHPCSSVLGFPGGSAGKESACNAGGLGSIPGEGKGHPHLYSGLENSLDCIVHGVSVQTFVNHAAFQSVFRICFLLDVLSMADTVGYLPNSHPCFCLIWFTLLSPRPFRVGRGWGHKLTLVPPLFWAEMQLV